MRLYRSRNIALLILAVAAYTTGLTAYAHVRLAHGGNPAARVLQCMQAAPSETPCGVRARDADSTEDKAPAQPDHRFPAHKDCPLCQALMATTALPDTAIAQACFDRPAGEYIPAENWDEPSISIPSSRLTRGPPSVSL
jgi:hypothetical protein